MSFVAEMLGPEGIARYEVEWTENGLHRRPSEQKADRIVIPGLVDPQIYGYNGADLLQDDTARLHKMCDELAELGYEGCLLSTVSTNAAANYEALEKLPEHDIVKGVHVEGPFFSPKKSGAHNPDALEQIPNGESEWDKVFDHPKLSMMTIAPELQGAPELFQRLAAREVVISMGHSDATFEEAKKGFEAGARQATHTYNAMRGLHHREPGILGFSLVEDELDAELIYDRIHVSKPAAEVLLRCKPTHRVIGMSDGTMAAGMPAGKRFKMWGLDVYTGEGEVRLVETDGPAGSAVTQLDVFRCMAEDFGLRTAIQACCINPRRVLKMTESPRVWIEMDLDLQIMQVHRV